MKKNGAISSLLQQFFNNKSPENRAPELLTQGEFSNLLNKEKLRADRLNSPFSVIIFKLPDQRYCSLSKRLVEQLNKLSRVIDEVGFISQSQIAVYLFNTPSRGADIFLKRVEECFEQIAEFTPIINVYPDQLSRPKPKNVDINKRQIERLPLHLNAKVQVNSTSNTIEATTLNISADGAFFMSDDQLIEDTEVCFEISLPIGNIANEPDMNININAIGKVVRTERHGFAVAFEKS